MKDLIKQHDILEKQIDSIKDKLVKAVRKAYEDKAAELKALGINVGVEDVDIVWKSRYKRIVKKGIDISYDPPTFFPFDIPKNRLCFRIEATSEKLTKALKKCGLRKDKSIPNQTLVFSPAFK